jgi:uncharacterized protein
MLAIRPNCECCDCDLPNGSPEARICSFECTFCSDCAQNRFGGRCPNCGGDLVLRPTRPVAKLVDAPASPARVTKPHAGCAGGVAASLAAHRQEEDWAGRDQDAHGHGPRKNFGASAPGEHKSMRRSQSAASPKRENSARRVVHVDERVTRCYYTK